jgi:hypothetical protein
MQESVYKERVQPRRLPADAPNILIVLIDDAGPALPATFGGEVQIQTMDRIVKEGIAYNRFHTTAMCSPTHEGARDMARDIAKTEAYRTSRCQRKKVEMLFATSNAF